MQLAALLDQVTYGEEENIIVQGRLGDSMYIIEPGCSPPKVFVEGVGLVATLEAGSFFGELAILDAPASWRTATVKTASETTLLRLSQKDIHRLLSGEKCQELLQMGSRAYDERQQLRGSDDVKTAVRKLWRLLVAESFKLEEKVQGRVARLSKWKRMRMSAVGGSVSRDGYNKLHMCISKYLVQGFTRTEAEESAEADWAEDITAFGGDSKINLHLENLKQQLLAATEQSVGSKGWQGLFELYDDDGSGEIGAKNASFEPFCTRSNHFTKTGSGQTQGKLKTRCVFVQTSKSLLAQCGRTCGFRNKSSLMRSFATCSLRRMPMERDR